MSSLSSLSSMPPHYLSEGQSYSSSEKNRKGRVRFAEQHQVKFIEANRADNPQAIDREGVASLISISSKPVMVYVGHKRSVQIAQLETVKEINMALAARVGNAPMGTLRDEDLEDNEGLQMQDLPNPTNDIPTGVAAPSAKRESLHDITNRLGAMRISPSISPSCTIGKSGSAFSPVKKASPSTTASLPAMTSVYSPPASTSSSSSTFLSMPRPTFASSSLSSLASPSYTASLSSGFLSPALPGSSLSTLCSTPSVRAESKRS